jgi:hypothetical protein
MSVRDKAATLSAKVFRAAERLGIHVMPIHYYTPVASRRWLQLNESSWRRPGMPTAIPWDLEEQGRWLRETASTFSSEVPLAEICRAAERVGGFRYGPIEAQLLHGFIRQYKPSRVVEIGSGSTTLIMSDAAGRNQAEGGPQTTIEAIDPYAGPGLAGLSGVKTQKISALELTASDLGLAAGDLLFIDSTHAVHTGSEVAHLYLSVIPQLPPGVFIHVHDIFFPYLYPPDLYEWYFDWQETVLVAALLTNNAQLQVLACLSALHGERPDLLGEVFSEYRPRPLDRGLYANGSVDLHFPSSLWLRTSYGDIRGDYEAPVT